MTYAMYPAGSLEAQAVDTLPGSAKKQEMAFCDACYRDRDVWVDAEGNVYYGEHEHQYPTPEELDAAFERATHKP